MTGCVADGQPAQTLHQQEREQQGIKREKPDVEVLDNDSEEGGHQDGAGRCGSKLHSNERL